MEFAYFHFDLKAFSGRPPFCLVCSAPVCMCMPGCDGEKSEEEEFKMHLIPSAFIYV